MWSMCHKPALTMRRSGPVPAAVLSREGVSILPAQHPDWGANPHQLLSRAVALLR